MGLISLGEKELLEITACSVSADGTVSPDEGDKYTVEINPSDYKWDRQISFSEDKSIGSIGNTKKFDRVSGESVSFFIMIDGTGATLNSDSVNDQLDALYEVLGYDGSEHEPKHSRLNWGTMVFYGRMSSIDVDYQLFKPSGEPLRAKVSLKFDRFMTTKEENQEANRSSPDLTHIVEVKAGDTLPLLCYQIYKDSRYYTDIARINNLDNFRQLQPGLTLIFPPLS